MSSVDVLKETTQSVLSRLEELSINSYVVPIIPSPSTSGARRIRTRGKRNKDVAVEATAVTVSSSDDPIDHRMQFLLELLRLPELDWVQHISAQAVDKGIILKQGSRRNGNKYAWNRNHAENDHTVSLLKKLNGCKAETSKPQKKRRFLNLDEAINELIEDKKYHVTLSPHKIRNEAELDKALKRFAETLELAGMGYVTEGELFVTKQGNTAFVRTDPEVVLRNQKLRRCGLNGDIVQVFVFKTTTTIAPADDDEDDDEDIKDVEELEELAKCSAIGFVIRVVKRLREITCVGQFGSTPATQRTNNLLFYPHERGIPPVQVPMSNLKPFIPKDMAPDVYFRTLSQHLFEVEVSGYNSFYHVCTGSVVADVGMKGNIKDENACILMRHGFKKRGMDRLDRLGEAYVKSQTLQRDDPGRRDLTDMCIFTIDPATARDLDDAVSCRQLPNGNYEVGIHISDVTHFVLEDSDLDSLVREAKTTSVYMVDQVYHMLPAVLCQTCSLLPGERKLAVSLFVELNPQAEVVGKEFTRSVINSCCQLAYEQAQKIIDDEDPLTAGPVTIYNEFTAGDLRTRIKMLHSLAKIMRKRRMDNGALKFDKPKYYFKLDADKNPVELLPEMSKPANHLIEEFMILANEIVGEYIYDAYPSCAILRQHSPPKLDQMAKVKTFFREQNFPDLNYRTAKEINASMDAILAESDRRGLDRVGFELVLNGLLAKPMNRAQYFCSGDSRYADRFDHFALSIPFYTHFTSPIRRYPDILVHRLLIRAINNQPEPKTWDLADINDLMADCNREKMNSRYASEDSGRLFLMYFLRAHYPEGRVMKATVCNILQRSIEVKLWETGDELNVHLEDLESIYTVTKLEEGGILVSTLKAEQGGENTPKMKNLFLNMFSTCDITVTVDKERLKATLLI